MKRKTREEKQPLGVRAIKKQRTSEAISTGHNGQKKKARAQTQWHKPSLASHWNMENQTQNDGAESSKRKKTGSCMKHKKKDKVLKHGKHTQARVKRAHGVKPSTSGGTQNNVTVELVETPGERDVTQPDLAVRLPESPQEYSSNWKVLSKMLESQRKRESHKRQREKNSQRGKQHKHSSHLDSSLTAADGNPPSQTSMKDVWFDDVDDILLDGEMSQANVKGHGQQQPNPLVKPQSYNGLTKALGMDCEMVGVGEAGTESILARVSIVNHYGQCVYDEHVKPTERVIDYRTHVSGIRKGDLLLGKDISVVQREVHEMLDGRILVGHALHHDLQVLYLDHPRKMIRDTSMYKPFRSLFQGRTPSLKNLTQKLLNVAVQEGEHSSVQDAQAAMRLYTMYRQQWEKDIREGKHKPRLVKEKREKKRNPSRLRRLKHKQKHKTCI